MIDRMDKRDKHQAAALIKARPHAMVPPRATATAEPGIDALEQRFEALLRGTRGLADAIAEHGPLAPSPLMPNFEAVPGQTGVRGQAGNSLAQLFSEALEPPPTQAADASPGSAPHDLQAQHALGAHEKPQETQGAQGEDPTNASAESAPQATPASLDPRVLNAQRKRKLQMQTKMQEDAAKATIQEQAAARPAQHLPPPSGRAASGSPASATRIDGIGAIGQADIAPRLPPASLSADPRFQADAAPGTHDLQDASAIAQKEAFSQELAQDEYMQDPSAPSAPARQEHRRDQSERQEILAAETAAAQVVQGQMLVQSNTPESLPLHLLESI
jgi:hypothetical protein